MSIGLNLTLAWRLKPQLQKQNPPARVIKVLIFRQSAYADLECNSLRILFARA
jgi:hypothetical protein